MNTKLDDLLLKISDEYRENLQADARNYLEVDLGRRAEKLGYADLTEKYRNVFAVVPLKQPVHGMKVRIDGRTFVKYAQFDSGVAVPGYVAEEAGLPRKPFVPNDSMILNFTD